MIDNNPLEIEAMACFKNGEKTKAQKLQREFLEQVKNSDEDSCSCKAKCEYHGKCFECVIIHRGHGDHLPNCFRDMVNKRIQVLSGLTENTYQNENK